MGHAKQKIARTVWPLLALAAAAASSPAAARAQTIGATRQACETALAREQAGLPTLSSRTPCHNAFLIGGQPEDLRNEVASLMSPVRKTSLDDVAIGALMADAATRKASNQPWGYLARCDLARRLGSAATLAACLEDLRRIAPEHPASRLAFARPAERTSTGVWLARALLLLGLLGAVAHAGYRAARRHRRDGARPAPVPDLARVVLIACALSSLFATGVARGEPAEGKEQLSDFPIDDANPEASVPAPEIQNRKPLEFGYFLQDLAAKAEKAQKRGDHAAEARYYRALTAAAPKAAFGPRRLCAALEAAGDRPGAVVACRTAITRTGSTSADYVRFVGLVLGSKGPLPPDERKELDLVLMHLESEAQLGAVPTFLRCEVALRFKDVPSLEACTAQLGKLAPNDPKTVSLQWALALEKNDRVAALKLIDRARDTGMSEAGLAKMEAGTREMSRRRLERLAALLAAAAFIGGALGLGIRRLATRRQAAA